jgi:stage II sporulation protein AA (anti-sigma F factor antagonist)
MDILFTKRDRNIIISLEGEIDHHAADALKYKIDREYDRSRAKNIIFDFGKVEFMDSSGIGMIIGRYKNVERQGGEVRAVCSNAAVRRIIEVSGLGRLIKCYNSTDDAEESLK